MCTRSVLLHVIILHTKEIEVLKKNLFYKREGEGACGCGSLVFRMWEHQVRFPVQTIKQTAASSRDLRLWGSTELEPLSPCDTPGSGPTLLQLKCPESPIPLWREDFYLALFIRSHPRSLGLGKTDLSWAVLSQQENNPFLKVHNFHLPSRRANENFKSSQQHKWLRAIALQGTATQRHFRLHPGRWVPWRGLNVNNSTACLFNARSPDGGTIGRF